MAGRLKIVSISKAGRGPCFELEQRYLRRIARYAPCERLTVAASRRRRPADRRREEAERLESHRPARGTLVALDRRGDPLSSEELAARVARWRERGELVLVIGGPDGLDATWLASCSQTISLGALTLPHELAAVVLLEQLYRGLAAANGHPYAGH
ncbi:MAG: 23S rRNA (pseudouridine(1915)-N(3))-methyltransferase RlmH [Acidobacteriota bacterium]|nr:MAG: 23S rRNA (pseudouridine(1915)-N(3))-methyltransferase RlmH [Acidobacteriota bacterium]